MRNSFFFRSLGYAAFFTDEVSDIFRSLYILSLANHLFWFCCICIHCDKEWINKHLAIRVHVFFQHSCIPLLDAFQVHHFSLKTNASILEKTFFTTQLIEGVC